MTRREYLTALNQYLVTMSESEKTAILKEYDEHYRRGFEAGKTEAQVSASLGSPYDVANELLAGRRPPVPTYPPKPRPQTSQTSQTSQNGAQRSGTYQPRTATAAPSRPAQQQIFSEPAHTHTPQQPSYSAPSYPSQQPSYAAPSYPSQQQSYRSEEHTSELQSR